MPIRRHGVRRLITGCIAGAVLAGALAGCGEGSTAGTAAANIAAAVSSASAAAQTAEPPAITNVTTAETDAPTSASTGTSLAVKRNLNRTGWYDGFAITVVDASATPGFGDDVDVEVSFLYENLGIEKGRAPQGAIEADGVTTDGEYDNPDGIPGQGKGKGSVVFTVAPPTDAALDLGDAMDAVTLVYGDASDNQTKIPLADDGKVDSVEPQKITTTGTMKQGDITIEVLGGSLAPSYESGEKGKALLNLRITLTCAPGCAASGYNTGFEQFSVTGPGGTSVTADDRSEYCCDALYPETVSDSERNVLTFVVPAPATGRYTLTYSNPNLTSAGTAPATLPFTA